jgi:CRP/FNR family transcriptional regulator
VLQPAQITALGLRFPDIAADGRLMQELSAVGLAAHLTRGQSICHEGDACSQLALLTSGAARVFKLAESGREITLYRVEPGECCILTASCMLSGRAFPANAVVESDLEAVLVPEPQLLKWMTTSGSWRHFLWSLLAGRLGDVISLVEEVAFRRMDERLAEYLAEYALHRGPVLQATHGQIAADLGTSREVVSRVLKDFELRGLLQLSRGRIELSDPQALRALATV